MRATNGKQIPWESTSLEEDFYFLPPASVKKPPPTIGVAIAPSPQNGTCAATKAASAIRSASPV